MKPIFDKEPIELKLNNPGTLRCLASCFAVALLLVACGGREGTPAPTFGTKQMGVAGAYTYGNSVVTDANGNVYVAGFTQGHLDGNILRGITDYFFTKYDYTGIKFYTKQSGYKGKDTYGLSTATDASGNVYVTGYTGGGLDGNTLTGIYDFFLTKYNAAGNRRYTMQMGVAGAETIASSVAIDANGNVYVTGQTNGGLDGNTLTGTFDFFLTKYDAAGTKLYTRQMGVASTDISGNPIPTNTNASSVATDPSGNVYVTGNTEGGLDGNTPTGTSDFFLTKYDVAGNKLYTKQMGVVGKIAISTSVATDAKGNVYVTGYTDGGLDGNTLTGIPDFFLAKFDTTGNKLYTRQMGVVGKFTIGTSVTTDAHNYVYVAGFTDGGLNGNTLTGTTDFFLMKFNSAGTRL